MIGHAGIEGQEKNLEAMNGFVRAYWKPIYYFVRARGYPTEKAEDLTQEFLLQLMERDWLRRADQERGRFRNFILRVLVRFLADQGPSRSPLQRQFEGRLQPISTLVSDEDRSFEPSGNLTPEEIFERRWAMSIVDSVRELLRQSYSLENKSAWYDVFVARYLTDPARGRPSETELGQRLGLSRDQVRYAQQQTKARFFQLLKFEVRGQTGDEDLAAAMREVLELAARHVPTA